MNGWDGGLNSKRLRENGWIDLLHGNTWMHVWKLRRVLDRTIGIMPKLIENYSGPEIFKFRF